MTVTSPPRPAGTTDHHRSGPVRVRRLPVPDSAPPFDDERAPVTGGQVPLVQGALALEYLLAGGLPAVPMARPQTDHPRQLHLLGSPPGRDRVARSGTSAQPDSWSARQRTRRAELPEPRAWALRLVQGLLEVLAGERPVTQLARWTDEALYADLSVRADRAARGRRRAVPPRHPRSAPVRAYVRSVHVCEPVDGVVESTALVQVGSRCRALALRMEGLDGRWRATVAAFV